MKGVDCRDLPGPGFLGATQDPADPGSTGKNPLQTLGISLTTVSFLFRCRNRNKEQ